MMSNKSYKLASIRIVVSSSHFSIVNWPWVIHFIFCWILFYSTYIIKSSFKAFSAVNYLLFHCFYCVDECIICLFVIIIFYITLSIYISYLSNSNLSTYLIILRIVLLCQLSVRCIVSILLFNLSYVVSVYSEFSLSLIWLLIISIRALAISNFSCLLIYSSFICNITLFVHIMGRFSLISFALCSSLL